MPGDRIDLPPPDYSVFTAPNEMFDGIPYREVDQLDIGPGKVCYAPGTPLPTVSWAKLADPRPPASWWVRLRRRYIAFKYRAIGAWEVLRGDAEAVGWDDLS